jgi:hypothetical protein
VRRQQTLDQRLQPVGFLDDDLGVFAQLLELAFGQFEFEQLRRAANPAERILDLMREIADQLLVRLALIEDAFFAVELELLDIFAQFDQYRHAGQIEGRDRRMHVQGFTTRALERQIQAFVVELMRQRLLKQIVKRVTVDEVTRQRLVLHGFQRTVEQALGGRIEIADAAIDIEDHDCRGQQFEAGKGIAKNAQMDSACGQGRAAAECLLLIAEFAAQRVDIFFGARQFVLHVRHAGLVLGIIAFIAVPLGLAVVVVFFLRGELLFLGAHFIEQDLPTIAVARLLGAAVYLGKIRRRRRRA